MEQQSSESNNSHKQKHSQNSQKKSNRQRTRNLYALIGESSYNLMPYRSKFQLNSIDSGKSRQSRDSDLLNRLAKNNSSKASSKSLSRNVSFQYLNSADKQHKSQLNSSKSNSMISQSQKSIQKHENQKHYKQKHDMQKNDKQKLIQTYLMVPRIHNCVCSVAGECLGYNCNCFLSSDPCAPDCCQNCLTLKTSLPLKFTNVCSCKKTRCLKLYCQCLAKGLYCNPLCKCELCQNHQLSVSRIQSIHNYQMHKGCSCQKTYCRKKYCQCFAQGLKCTSKCVCLKCQNYLVLTNQDGGMQQQMDREDEEMQFQSIDFFGKKK